MKEELGIRDYIEIMDKRRWTVLSVFLLFVFAVAAVTFMMTPVYRATAQVYIDTGSADFNLNQTSRTQVDNLAYLQTQINIIKSEAVARKVIDKLRLDRLEGNAPKEGFSLASLAGGGGPPEGRDGYEAATGRFLKRLDVEVVKNSNLVKVSYETESPELAANVANETVQAFIERNLEMKVGPAKEYMAWLNEELTKIKERMNESSSRLEDYKKDRNLLVSGDRQTNISLLALTDLNSKALSAEARRYTAEIKYQQVMKLARETDGLMSHPDVINNKVIQELKSQQGGLAKEIAEGSKKYGEKHPQMVRLANEMGTLRKQMQAEVDLIVSAIKNDYEESLRAERSLKGAFARQKAEAMNYDKRSSEYELKKQDVEGARNIYDQVLKKFQESNLLGTMSVSNVQFFDRAVPPRKPYKPKKALNLLLGMVLGAFTAAGFALVSEHMDNTFSSPEELEERLGLPILGIVPKTPAQDGKHGDSIIAVTDPVSPMAESFRTIRSNILLSRREHTPRVLQVCSALQAEGKSTVAVNLSCIMAGAGDSVLLIDGDMRRPRLHRVFDVQNGRGLSSVLTKKAALADVLKKTSVNNLSFMPSGPLYANPGELLGSTEMFNMVAELRERFDRVVIDCPPYLGIADASLLTPLSDGVVLVVRSGKTIKDAVVKIKKNMDIIKAEILGVVLNDMSSRSMDYYYHYDYTNYVSKKKAA